MGPQTSQGKCISSRLNLQKSEKLINPVKITRKIPVTLNNIKKVQYKQIKEFQVLNPTLLFHRDYYIYKNIAKCASEMRYSLQN
jgi:hypothetical protein